MSFVLITGASAGIGESFARQLAKQGTNLIISARRLERLESLAAELESSYQVNVICVAADLSSTDGVDVLVSAINQNDIEINGLVNNAGFGEVGAFSEIPIENQLNMVQVNVSSLIALTYKLLPKLQQKQGAFIINVASTAAFQAGPNMAIYYATKAFVLSFSEALTEELGAFGIKVSALCPGATESEFAELANLTNTRLFKLGAMSKDKVVATALKKIHKGIVIPGIKNYLLAMLTRLSPRSLNRKIAGWLHT